jgi:hypothetical protein
VLTDDSGLSGLGDVAVKIEEVSVPGILANDPALPRSGAGSTTFDGLLPGTYRVTVLLPEGVFTADPDLTTVNGRFAIVKTVTVTACAETALDLHVFTKQAPVPANGKVEGPVTLAAGLAHFNVQANNSRSKGRLEWTTSAGTLIGNVVTAVGIAPDRKSAWFVGRLKDGREFIGYVQLAPSNAESAIFRLWIAGSLVSGDGKVLSGRPSIRVF